MSFVHRVPALPCEVRGFVRRCEITLRRCNVIPSVVYTTTETVYGWHGPLYSTKHCFHRQAADKIEIVTDHGPRYLETVVQNNGISRYVRAWLPFAGGDFVVLSHNNHIPDMPTTRGLTTNTALSEEWYYHSHFYPLLTLIYIS